MKIAHLKARIICFFVAFVVYWSIEQRLGVVGRLWWPRVESLSHFHRNCCVTMLWRTMEAVVWPSKTPVSRWTEETCRKRRSFDGEKDISERRRWAVGLMHRISREMASGWYSHLCLWWWFLKLRYIIFYDFILFHFFSNIK